MVLEKHIIRYLKIITHIYYQPEQIIGKKDLLNDLEISNTTLNNDISKLNNIFQENIISQKKTNISLNLSKDCGLKQIYKVIIKNSMVVTYFYEVAMYHPEQELLYHDLYLSESMEYRIRTSWNQHFINLGYDAKFIVNNKTRKIDLIGDENTIRSLMTYMLDEYLREEIFDNLQYNEVENYIEKIYLEYNLSINYTHIDLISGSIFVSLVRISQGYRNTSKYNNNFDILDNLLNFLVYEENILKSIKKVFDIDVSLPILVDITGGKLLELLSLIGLNRTTSKNYNKQQLNYFIRSYSKLIINSTINLSQEELNVLQGIIDFSDFKVSNFVYNPNKLYWDSIAFKKDKEIFNDLLKSTELNILFPNEDKKYEFFFYLHNMLTFKSLETISNKKKIIIVSRYPTFYQKKIALFLNNRYQEFLNLEIYNGKIHELRKMDLQDFDWIISELKFSYVKKKHIFLPESLSKNFIKELDNLIFQF